MATDKVIDFCARAAHEINRLYCLSHGDASQPHWENAPDWQQQSARNGVRGALNGNNTPEESHLSWMMEKIETGWVYGPVKDPEKKQHPCMVPYGQLPPEQQRKDTLFLATVRAMAAALS